MAKNATLEKARTETSADLCYRLVYRSHSLLPARTDGGETSLADILRVARSNNLKSDITGALVLYEYKNRFAQVLEGPEEAILALFRKIKSDTRHENISVVSSESAKARLFSRWAMTLVVEQGNSDIPLMASTGGLSEAAPRRVTAEQESILTQLRDLTRGYGRAY